MLAEIGHHLGGRFASPIFAYRRHASSVTAIDTPVPAMAPMAARRQAAASADSNTVFPIRLKKVSAVSDVGLVIHISSPRMARVAKELSSLGGGVTMGLTASQTAIGSAQHHRRVQTGTSNIGVDAQRDQALTGWQCLSKIQPRTA